MLKMKMKGKSQEIRADLISSTAPNEKRDNEIIYVQAKQLYTI